jgi:hypothetical protein
MSKLEWRDGTEEYSIEVSTIKDTTYQESLSAIYSLAELGEHRDASKAIFKLFEEILESKGNIDELLNMIDVSKLTSFEIKTFAVASRPIARRTDSYRRLMEKFSDYLAMNSYNTDLLEGFRF